VTSTLARHGAKDLPWDEAAKAKLDQLVELHPVIARISAAKRLKDAAENETRRRGEERVTAARVEALR